MQISDGGEQHRWLVPNNPCGPRGGELCWQGQSPGKARMTHGGRERGASLGEGKEQAGKWGQRRREEVRPQKVLVDVMRTDTFLYHMDYLGCLQGRAGPVKVLERILAPVLWTGSWRGCWLDARPLRPACPGTMLRLANQLGTAGAARELAHCWPAGRLTYDLTQDRQERSPIL